MCSNCTNWPSTGYEVRTDDVPDDEICKGCRRKVETGNCRHGS